MDRLRQTYSINLENRSLRVSAGYRLSENNQRLEEHGLFFLIDLGADSMVGGMIATNTWGARFIRYGDVRSNTQGLKVVLDDSMGTTLKLGSGVRKDNSGVDWKHLFIGTSGSFGLVAEAVLNLELLPQQSAVALIEPETLQACSKILAASERALGTQLTAFEYVSGRAIRHTFDHVPGLRNPFQESGIPDNVLLIEATRTWAPRASEQSLDDLLVEFLTELWELPGSPIKGAQFPPPEVAWGMRHSVPEGTKNAG